MTYPQLNLSYLLVVYMIVSCSGCQQASPPLPPNIIIIFTDDQGYQDLGCFGSPDIETPNLDQMANRGIRLTQFYAAQAVCSASRAGLLTGCYPNRIGIHNALMPNSPIGLHPDEVTLAELLKQKEYATALYGKWHLGDHPDFLPTRQGFDEFFGIPYSNDMWPNHPQQGTVFNFPPLPLYEGDKIVDTLTDQTLLTTQLTERSVDFIHRNSKKPFFLYLAHPQPHVPLFVSDRFKGKSKRGLYGDVIMEIDWSVGEIMKALRTHEIEKNTLVIFTSDNGPWLSYGTHAGSALPLREGKGTAFEGGQREPTVMYMPGTLPAGRTITTPMMTIDLLPTIAHLTGTRLPDCPIDGKNIWDVLTGVSDKSPQQAYYYYYKVNELHGVRYGDWKMYFPHNYRTLNGRPGGIDGRPAPYDYIDLTSIELYNLSTDTSELHNVADQFPDVVKHIKVLADSMRIRLGDRLTLIEGNENRIPGRVDEK